MFRIDSEGATVDNRFTEGDPQQGIPATVVSDDWLNAVQGELATIVESAGIALVKGEIDQVFNGILEIFLRGGRVDPVIQDLANNSTNQDVTGIQIDGATTKTKIMMFDIERSTDSETVIQTGVMFLTYDNKAQAMKAPSFLSVHDFAGVDFSTELVSAQNYKLRYSTNDLAGANYVGKMRITSIFEIRQAAA